MQVLRKLKLPNSLRAKMLLWAFVFVVPILAILYATIWTAAESFETQTRGSINQTLTPYSADIDATLASAKLYIANLRVDLSLLSESVQQTPSGLQALNSLAEDISEDMALYPQIDAFFLGNAPHISNDSIFFLDRIAFFQFPDPYFIIKCRIKTL